MPQYNWNTIFVGDIPIFTKEADLDALFCCFGHVVDVKVKHNIQNDKTLAYGFVTFSNESAAQEAMLQMEGATFCGRRLRIRWAQYNAKGNGGANNATQAEEVEKVVNSVYVRFSCQQKEICVSEDSLQRTFSMFGVVLSVTIKEFSINSRTLCQTGYAFVHFTSDEAGVEAAFATVSQLDNTIFNGVTYNVEPSKKLLTRFSQRQLPKQQGMRTQPGPSSVQQQQQQSQYQQHPPMYPGNIRSSSSPIIMNAPRPPLPLALSSSPSGTSRLLNYSASPQQKQCLSFPCPRDNLGSEISRDVSSISSPSSVPSETSPAIVAHRTFYPGVATSSPAGAATTSLPHQRQYNHFGGDDCVNSGEEEEEEDKADKAARKMFPSTEMSHSYTSNPSVNIINSTETNSDTSDLGSPQQSPHATARPQSQLAQLALLGMECDPKVDELLFQSQQQLLDRVFRDDVSDIGDGKSNSNNSLPGSQESGEREGATLTKPSTFHSGDFDVFPQRNGSETTDFVSSLYFTSEQQSMGSGSGGRSGETSVETSSSPGTGTGTGTLKQITPIQCGGHNSSLPDVENSGGAPPCAEEGDAVYESYAAGSSTHTRSSSSKSRGTLSESLYENSTYFVPEQKQQQQQQQQQQRLRFSQQPQYGTGRQTHGMPFDQQRQQQHHRQHHHHHHHHHHGQYAGPPPPHNMVVHHNPDVQAGIQRAQLQYEKRLQLQQQQQQQQQQMMKQQQMQMQQPNSLYPRQPAYYSQQQQAQQQLQPQQQSQRQYYPSPSARSVGSGGGSSSSGRNSGGYSNPNSRDNHYSDREAMYHGSQPATGYSDTYYAQQQLNMRR